jgi:hypothetical protein
MADRPARQDRIDELPRERPGSRPPRRAACWATELGLGTGEVPRRVQHTPSARQTRAQCLRDGTSVIRGVQAYDRHHDETRPSTDARHPHATGMAGAVPASA